MHPLEKLVPILDKLAYYPLAIKDKIYLHGLKKNVSSLADGIREKEKIKVLFVLSSLPKWKSETLYQAMLAHPRFEPVIGVALGVVDYPTYEAKQLDTLIEYLDGKSYPYTELRLTSDIQERISPNIVLYQQADGGLYDCLLFRQLHDVLFGYIAYGVANGVDAYAYNNIYHNACWFWAVENQLVVDYAKTVMTNHAKNVIPTGTPMMDELLAPKTQYIDPWKKQSKEKKRIIWAPHHTIGIGKEEIHYGTFLQVAEGMVELAKKYSDEVQWTFKPHPSLKQKLYYLWGENRTNACWDFWTDSENCQIEEGKYIPLFKYSDALIHDCGSFTTEYLYMQKPCMYLVNGRAHPLNDFGRACYDMHYKGECIDDVERFVSGLVNDIDPLFNEREQFFQEVLLPPNGKTACENIINYILGKCPT